MGWIDVVMSSNITPSILAMLAAGLIVIAFVRGWVLTPWQVKAITDLQNLRLVESNQRAEDWKQAYYAEKEAKAVLAEQVDRLKVVGDLLDRVVRALPAPERTD